MTLHQWFAIAVIGALIAVSAAHSILGEKMLLKPIFKARGNRVLENSLARMVLRGAWHLTSLTWAIIACIVYSASFASENLASSIFLIIGLGFVFAGIVDMIWSRGKHVGWPLLLAVGVFAFLALWQMNSAGV